jgi:hypothetical protein
MAFKSFSSLDWGKGSPSPNFQAFDLILDRFMRLRCFLEARTRLRTFMKSAFAFVAVERSHSEKRKNPIDESSASDPKKVTSAALGTKARER